MKKLSTRNFVTLALLAAILWSHRENIRRLLAGTERKFLDKKNHD